MDKKGKKEQGDLTSALLKLQALREKVKQQEEAIIKEELLRKESENLNQKLMAETSVIAKSLEVEKVNLRKYQDKIDEMTAQKENLERKIQDMQRRMNHETEDVNKLLLERRRAEEEIQKLQKNIKGIETEMTKYK